MNSKNQAIKNTIFSMFDTIFLPLFMLLITPLFIEKLGLQNYAFWMLINSVVVVMSLLNFGGGDTIIKYVSYYLGNDDRESSLNVFSTVFFLQFILAIIFSIVGYYISPIIFHSDIINTGSLESSEFIFALRFGFIVFSLKLLEQAILSNIKAYERYDIASFLSIFSKFMIIISQILAAFVFEGGVQGIFAFSSLMMIFLIILNIYAVKKIIPGTSLVSRFDKEILYKILNFTKWTWFISIVGTISSQIDRWVLASLANLSTLGIYSIVTLIFNNIHMVLASSVAWVFPKTSRENSPKAAYNCYCILQGGVLLVSLFISFVLLECDFIFRAWMSKALYMDSVTYLNKLLYIIPLYSLSIVPFYMIKGNGLMKNSFYSDLITLLIRFSLIYYLYQYYALDGIIIAVGISGLFISSYLTFIVFKKVFKKPWYMFLFYLVVPIVYLSSFYFDNSATKFVIFLFSIVLIFCIFFRGFKHKVNSVFS